MPQSSRKRSGPRVDLGQAVADRRRQLDLSQEELAHEADLHRTYVGGVERGERNPSFEALIKLADALEIHVSVLLARVRHRD